MASHVLDCFEETTNRLQFKKTMEQLKRYTGTKCKKPQDLTKLWEMENPSIPPPMEPTNMSNNKIKELVLEQSIKAYVDRTQQVEENMVHLFGVI